MNPRLFKLIAVVSLGVCVVFVCLWVWSAWFMPNGIAPQVDLPGWSIVFWVDCLIVGRREGRFTPWEFRIGYSNAAIVSALLPIVWLVARRWRQFQVPATSRKLTGIVGLVASLACGWQVYQLIMWQVWGAPANPLHPFALLGAFGLFLASLGVLFDRGRTAFLALLISVVPLWIFYAPASVSYMADGGLISNAAAFVPPALLLGATVLAAVGVKGRQTHGTPVL